METKVELNSIYSPSEEVVARDIHGEFVIVPITSGIGDLEDEIFSLNETGRAIWDKLDGKRKLKEVIDSLTLEFEAPKQEIKKDILGLTEELLKRRMLIEVKRD